MSSFDCSHRPGIKISGTTVGRLFKMTHCPCLDENFNPKPKENRAYCEKLDLGQGCPYVKNGHFLKLEKEPVLA